MSQKEQLQQQLNLQKQSAGSETVQLNQHRDVLSQMLAQLQRENAKLKQQLALSQHSHSGSHSEALELRDRVQQMQMLATETTSGNSQQVVMAAGTAAAEVGGLQVRQLEEQIIECRDKLSGAEVASEELREGENRLLAEVHSLEDDKAAARKESKVSRPL